MKLKQHTTKSVAEPRMGKKTINNMRFLSTSIAVSIERNDERTITVLTMRGIASSSPIFDMNMILVLSNNNILKIEHEIINQQIFIYLDIII